MKCKPRESNHNFIDFLMFSLFQAKISIIGENISQRIASIHATTGCKIVY